MRHEVWMVTPLYTIDVAHPARPAAGWKKIWIRRGIMSGDHKACAFSGDSLAVPEERGHAPRRAGIAHRRHFAPSSRRVLLFDADTGAAAHDRQHDDRM
jgi:hypothetical protein